MEWYKQFRPKDFDEVVGNKSTVMTIQTLLKTGFPHAVMFSGPSGCGKTTLARIVVSHLGADETDVIELNCADFRGIDTVREIGQRMPYAPRGKALVWILDEAHQLSKDGQNALLKMLEDTPAHVYFMLCTTEPEKLLRTIRTRCMEFPFFSLTAKELRELIERTLPATGTICHKDAVDAVIKACGGSPRQCLVMLEKLVTLPPAEQEAAVQEEQAQRTEAIDLCRALMRRAKWSEVAGILFTLTAEPESVRWVALGYAKAVLLKKDDNQAYQMIVAFSNPFYDTKMAGLVAACYEVVHGK